MPPLRQSVFPHFEVQVWAGGVSGAAGRVDCVTVVHLRPWTAGRLLCSVRVPGAKGASVLNDDRPAEQVGPVVLMDVAGAGCSDGECAAVVDAVVEHGLPVDGSWPPGGCDGSAGGGGGEHYHIPKTATVPVKVPPDGMMVMPSKEVEFRCKPLRRVNAVVVAAVAGFSVEKERVSIRVGMASNGW